MNSNEQEKKPRYLTMKEGDTASMTRTVLEEDIMRMAEISLDYNPIHVDEQYSKKTRFGGRIAHGLFCSSMISAILGNELPGLGTIIISESMEYKYPVYIGDTVDAMVKLETVNRERQRAVLSFECVNQNQKSLMTGQVKVSWGEEK